jgi:hypothetical protein
VQRREAILLLREIIDFPEATPFTFIYLKPHRRTCDSEDLELHVKTYPGSSNHRIIQYLDRKHSFLTKDEPDGSS